jgi:hypothetical protein
MTDANYGGRQQNNTAYVKTFVEGFSEQLWAVFFPNANAIPNTTTIVPIPPYQNIYIPNNIYLGGSIIPVPVSQNIPSIPSNIDVLQLTARIDYLEDRIRRLESL